MSDTPLLALPDSLELLETAEPLREGYTTSIETCPECGGRFPAFLISVGRTKIFETLSNMMEIYGNEGEIFVWSTRTSPKREASASLCIPVVRSTLKDFTDVLIGNGFMGMNMVIKKPPTEIIFDDDKQILVMTKDPQSYEKALKQNNVPLNQNMLTIKDYPHKHLCREGTEHRFAELYSALGFKEEDFS